jgi:aminoglycoside phosphotransferase (APT) family kinase protein
MDVLDKPTQVRAGEELDRSALAAYLQTHLGAADGADLEIAQFPGGWSNLTYLVRYGRHELVLRRPPFGSKVKSAHDMGREYRILRALHPVYPRVPRPVAYCQDDSVLGAPFYLMERVPGVILRRSPPPSLGLSAATMPALCAALCDTLVELHALDWRAAGLTELGKPEGYVERQVSGWSKRYLDAQTDEVPVIHEVMRWLADHQPPSPAPTLIHNDFKFDNLILDPADLTRVVAILDWEMATIGDPLMDLGTTLCYWIEANDPHALQAARFGPTTLPGSYTRAELCARYAERSQRDLSHVVFYYAFGLFKTAVVVQQIYYRYKQGLTRDARFANMADSVRVLAEQASRTIARGQV